MVLSHIAGAALGGWRNTVGNLIEISLSGRGMGMNVTAHSGVFRVLRARSHQGVCQAWGAVSKSVSVRK